jgi:hypothetical protein
MKFIGVISALFLASSAMAYTTDDERIDDYLNTLATAGVDTKVTMLNRMQWAGITSPRFYDEVEKQLLEVYLNRNLSRMQVKLASYEVRSLGYSGNEKYRTTLETLKKDAFTPKIKTHAGRALRDLDKFVAWNKAIADSTFEVDGKDAEVTTYMKMLNEDDVLVQRLAARAMFHEKQRDQDLLDLAADKLTLLYKKPGLSSDAQDTAAWLCKAIGQSGEPVYIDLLRQVIADTSYGKIKRHASKFTSQY